MVIHSLSCYDLKKPCASLLPVWLSVASVFFYIVWMLKVPAVQECDATPANYLFKTLAHNILKLLRNFITVPNAKNLCFIIINRFVTEAFARDLFLNVECIEDIGAI